MSAVAHDVVVEQDPVASRISRARRQTSRALTVLFSLANAAMVSVNLPSSIRRPSRRRYNWRFSQSIRTNVLNQWKLTSGPPNCMRSFA